MALNNNCTVFKADVMRINEAAKILKKAHSVLICTGAGMSKECGIPTFRDDDGMWKNLPEYRNIDIYPVKEMNVFSLLEFPEKTWGFSEWTRRKIASSKLHKGYAALNDWQNKFVNIFVHTTNTDGWHLGSGWPSNFIYEVHGSCWKLQCAGIISKPLPCTNERWDDRGVPLCELNEKTMLASNFPRCPYCGSLKRTNTLNFGGDYGFINDIEQYSSFLTFIRENCPQVIVIIGSSGQVPRNENLAQRWKMKSPKNRTIITINPNVHPDFSDIKLEVSAEEGLLELTASLNT